MFKKYIESKSNPFRVFEETYLGLEAQRVYNAAVALEGVVNNNATLTSVTHATVKIDLAIITHHDAGHKDTVHQTGDLRLAGREAVLCAQNLVAVDFVGRWLIDKGSDAVDIQEFVVLVLLDVAVVRNATNLSSRQQVGLIHTTPRVTKEGVINGNGGVNDSIAELREAVNYGKTGEAHRPRLVVREYTDLAVGQLDQADILHASGARGKVEEVV